MGVKKQIFQNPFAEVVLFEDVDIVTASLEQDEEELAKGKDPNKGEWDKQ